MVISKKYAFLIINFLMVACSMFSVTDFPLAGLCTKFKYVYIAYCMVDVLSRRKRPCGRNLILIFGLLVFYVLAWGFVFRNPIVALYISAHAKIMLLYLAMLILGTLELIFYDCIEAFTATSGTAFLMVLGVQVLLHPQELILNPVFAFRSFLAHDLVRSGFGFLDTNFVGNTCFLIASSFLMVGIGYSGNAFLHSRSKMLLALLGLLVFFIALSTSSRTPMICFAMFAMGSWVISLRQRLRFTEESVRFLKRAILVGTVLILTVFTAGDVWGYIWLKSNRALNVAKNPQWVPVLGSIWTGMGFVENGAFVTDASNNWISAFGVATSSLDMNYLYLYCTTGILGCVVMASVLILMGIGLYKNRSRKYGLYYLVLFAVVLFYAFWETVLFTYRFWGMIIPHIILLYGANKEPAE